MKTFKIRSSAVRAAKQEMGPDWMEFAEVIQSGERFEIVLKSTSALNSTIAAVQLLADNQADIDKKASKKAEIESRKPRHIPKQPVNIIVAEKLAHIPDPIPSPIEKIAPRADLEVPDDEPDYAADAAAADKQANIEAVNKDSAKPRLSSAEKPTKLVWHIADAMLIAAQKAGEPMPKRKDVIEECVRQGIAYGTSRTQYQHWFKCYNDSIAAPIATIGKDGKIVPPSK